VDVELARQQWQDGNGRVEAARADGRRYARLTGQVDAVEHIARHLVDDPDGVFVDANERGDNVTLLVHASPGDLGRIIGKRGRVIQAVRQVARAAGAAEGVRVSVDVAE